MPTFGLVAAAGAIVARDVGWLGAVAVWLALAYTLYRVIHLGWRVEWWRQGHGRPVKYGREAAMDIAAATVFVGLFLLDRITRNRPIGLLGALAFAVWWLVLVVWIWVGYHNGSILRWVRGERGGDPSGMSRVGVYIGSGLMALAGVASVVEFLLNHSVWAGLFGVAGLRTRARPR